MASHSVCQLNLLRDVAKAYLFAPEIEFSLSSPRRGDSYKQILTFRCTELKNLRAAVVEESERLAGVAIAARPYKHNDGDLPSYTIAATRYEQSYFGGKYPRGKSSFPSVLAYKVTYIYHATLLII